MIRYFGVFCNNHGFRIFSQGVGGMPWLSSERNTIHKVEAVQEDESHDGPSLAVFTFLIIFFH